MDAALDLTLDLDPRYGREAVVLAERHGDGRRNVAVLFLLAPEMLEHHGLDPNAVDPDTDFLTVETGEALRQRGLVPARVGWLIETGMSLTSEQLAAARSLAAGADMFAAGYLRDLSTLSPVPVLHLLIIVVGLPLSVAIVAWLLAGREPRSIARQPIG